MAFSASTTSQQSEINVTPLIYVLLVLLIIFMIIVPVTPRGLESSVPQLPRSVEPSLGPVSLQVLAGAQGQPQGPPLYEVDGRAVERGRLSAALASALRVRADRTVFVSGSPKLSYREIAAAVGVAKAAGATRIALGRL